ncbi:MAG TPA: DEAD/DEAH box helicase family protein [Clostridia bacterium]|nr:DEAD/DEAH box helicase family protein [Clostridia bacterium]
MMDVEKLCNRYTVISKMGYIDKTLPDYITKNFNPNFILREYQIEALARFIHYMEKDRHKIVPVHLLFNMATGSGKTLLMALNILYLYNKGYRHFLFFVNSTNIIEKTRENFLNSFSPKYLFNEKINFNGKEVKVREVTNFDEANEQDINIIFTTIQGLHSQLSTFRENSLTPEDFKGRKIVLISDEAHHINAWTRNKLNKDEQEIKNTWEYTIMDILHSDSENILLEYTATIDMENPSIYEKYKDKIIFEYDLKRFRNDGYSKDIKVLQLDLDNWDRMLQAVVLSQYRRKIAERNRIYLKPVILFRSKTIEESKENYELFRRNIDNLKETDIRRIKSSGKGTIIEKAFNFFQKENITIENLIVEIKEDFSEEKCIILDSENIDKEKQIKLNFLEAEDNEIRAIFAVKMLDEGWDVLNLFDIVRMYDTRDGKWTKDGKYVPGNTTIAEKQLIGRGARYYPFKIKLEDDAFRRKFDEDLDNELKILEELYYHSKYNPKYIQELTTVLKESGIMPYETREIEVKIKDKIKETKFWENGFIFINRREKYNRSLIKNIQDISLGKVYQHRLVAGISREDIIFNETEIKKAKDIETTTKVFKLGEFGELVIRKAMAKLEFYKFNNLKHYFPSLLSSLELIDSLKEINVEIITSKSKINNLTPDDKLDICINILAQLEENIRHSYVEYIGSRTFYPEKINKLVQNKKLKIAVDNSTDQERGKPMSDPTKTRIYLNIKDKDWYIYDENYGTSEEKYFIRFIDSVIDKLKNKYSEIYLLRNEGLFQIYRFSDGKPIEPDFVLFLKQKDTDKFEQYQLFIETKGDHLLQQDQWKEGFLQEIELEHKIKRTLFGENEKYKIIGMPFYNENNKVTFIKEFKKKLYIDF